MQAGKLGFTGVAAPQDPLDPEWDRPGNERDNDGDANGRNNKADQRADQRSGRERNDECEDRTQRDRTDHVTQRQAGAERDVALGPVGQRTRRGKGGSHRWVTLRTKR